MDSDIIELLKQYHQGSERALARLLTLIELADETSYKIIDDIFPNTGKARVVGVTGSPGSGKSTLVNALATAIDRQKKKVAVLAVDPSSPLSGGAVLGDRIRMSQASGQDGVFIRSIASRGAHGGLSHTIAGSIALLDGFGFDYILVETVGVGQAEVEIVGNAHTILLVVVPGMGDEVQAMKAGIMEIADIYVLNKADYSGADRLEKQLLENIVASASGWLAPVIKTVASKDEGVGQLLEKIALHRQWLETSGMLDQRKLQFVQNILKTQLFRRLQDEMESFLKNAPVATQLLAELSAKTKRPFACATQLLDAYRKYWRNADGT